MSNAAARPSLRALLKSGRQSVGGLCNIPSWFSAQLMAEAGFDWLFVDTEHAPISQETLPAMLATLDLMGVPAIVRVAWNRPELIGWTLDLGAQGVMVPMVNTPEQAREMVAACRYPPRGHRSWGPFRARALSPGYSPQSGDEEAVCTVLLETREAVGNLDAILDVEGIDIVAIGQSDLALAYGLHPSAGRSDTGHVARVQRILESCERRGLASWINCTDPGSAAAWQRKGFRMVSLESDVAHLAKAARAACDQLRLGIRPERQGAP